MGIFLIFMQELSDHFHGGWEGILKRGGGASPEAQGLPKKGGGGHLTGTIRTEPITYDPSLGPKRYRHPLMCQFVGASCWKGVLINFRQRLLIKGT